MTIVNPYQFMMLKEIICVYS